MTNQPNTVKEILKIAETADNRDYWYNALGDYFMGVVKEQKPVVNVHNWAVGRKVSGKYHGVTFTGTITHMRVNYANYKETIITIDLDETITVWDNDDSRDTVMLHVETDGTNKNGNYVR